MTFRALFQNRKPLISVLQLKSDVNRAMFARAREEIDIFYRHDADAVLVDNLFGSVADCEIVLAYLQTQYPNRLYGVHIWGNYCRAFSLAERYGAKFIQIESVCGHLRAEEDAVFGEELIERRKQYEIAVLGGVRVMDQPVRSARPLMLDLEIARSRCDAIVVTGDTAWARKIREGIGGFPLLTCSGVSIDTISETLSVTDGIIAGDCLKAGHSDYGDVCEAYVQAFTRKKRLLEQMRDIDYKLTEKAYCAVMDADAERFEFPSYDVRTQARLGYAVAHLVAEMGGMINPIYSVGHFMLGPDIRTPFRFAGFMYGESDGVSYRVDPLCFFASNPVCAYMDDVRSENADRLSNLAEKIAALSSGIRAVRAEALASEALAILFEIDPAAEGDILFVLPRVGEFQFALGEITEDHRFFPLAIDGFCMK